MRQHIVLFAVLASATASAVPVEFTAQGRMLDGLGNPISGTQPVLFELCTAPTGGSCPWSELRSSVSISDGYYSVVLGQTDPLDGADLAGDRWLRITVDGTRLDPPQALTSTPFARVSAAVQQDDGTPVVDTDGTIHVNDPSTCTPGVLRYASDQLYFCDDSSEWVSTASGGESTLGRSAATSAQDCLQILNTGAHFGSGTYWIDPSGSSPYRVYCDMDTAGGGWTLCGKYDRDGPGSRYLQAPFGRANENAADIATLNAFSSTTSRQVSTDCRDLISAGATQILSAAMNDHDPHFEVGRITSILAEVQANPVNLWDLNLDDESNDAASCVAGANITLDRGGNDIGTNDAGRDLGDQGGLVGDGAMWSVRTRPGAQYSNAANSVCTGTTDDTVFWSWRDGGVDDHGCGSFVIGTGCSTVNASMRFNFMLMR